MSESAGVSGGRRVQAWLFVGIGLAALLAPVWWSNPWLPLLAWPAAATLVVAVGLGRGQWRAEQGVMRGMIAALSWFGLVWLVLALTIAWPLTTVLVRPLFAPWLLLAAMLGLVLTLLWWAWPAFAESCRGVAGVGALLAAVERAPGPPALTRLPLAVLWLLALLPLPVLVLFGDYLAEWRRMLLLIQGALLPAAALLSVPMAKATEPESESKPVVAASAPAVAVTAAPDDSVARLYATAAAGRVQEALALLDQGGDGHALPGRDDADQRSLAMLAAVLPDLRLLRRLIAEGVDLDRIHAGSTPLLAATRDSWEGRSEAVATLLTNGADPRLADPAGTTPLHHAAHCADPAVALLLLDAGAAIDAVDGEGRTPLALACAVRNWPLARLLLDRGAACEPVDARPVLPEAVADDGPDREDDPTGVRLLLKRGAAVDARDSEGRTALLRACEFGRAETVRALLDAGADVDADDGRGRRPLLAAAELGHRAILEAVVAAGPDPCATTEDGRNALALLARSDRAEPEAVHLLVALGVEPGRADHEHRLPIEHMVAAGRWRLVLALDPRHPLPSGLGEALFEDDEQRRPIELLGQALLSGRLAAADRIERLIGVDRQAKATLFLELAEQPLPAALAWLSRRGAVEATTEGGDSIAFRLLARGPAAEPGLRCLLDAGEQFGGRGGLARFLDAAARAPEAAPEGQRLALELLGRGVDPFAPTPDGDSPLCLTVMVGWFDLAEALLDLGVDPNGRDGHGRTVLHNACLYGDERIVKALIRAGAITDLPTPDGQTPCGLALANGRADLARWLHWPDWRPPGRRLLPADLPAAAMIGDRTSATRLLDLGLPIDSVDSQGCTALLRACGGGYPELVASLLARSADPSQAARTGATPLSAAVSMRQAGIVRQLLVAGAEVDQALPGGITPLMLACALGFPELVSTLLAAGADVRARDEQGQTPAHCACMFAFQSREPTRPAQILDTLKSAGADFQSATEARQTPLLLALGARAEPGSHCDETVVAACVERLLEAGVSLSARDRRGFGPLHLAALHGLGGVLRRLLQAGADPDLRDTLNRPARDIALLRGFVDIAAEFEPARGGLSLARFLDRGEE